jgi:anti-sigma-K factor RskA
VTDPAGAVDTERVGTALICALCGWRSPTVADFARGTLASYYQAHYVGAHMASPLIVAVYADGSERRGPA